jgi:hypothetical protein
MHEVHGHCADVPGEETSWKEAALSTATGMVQKFAPMTNICEHVCGFHFYSGDLSTNVLAHHFCSVLNEDFRQCLIYDSNDKKAKLIGVEYIISERLYRTLPDDEARYWHSHVFEVKSGILSTPGVPLIAEHEVMKVLINTYGKTIHLWRIDRGDTLPLGPPQLMMAFTNESQVDWKQIEKVDGKSWKERRENRMDIQEPKKDPRADGWEKTGLATQFDVIEKPMKKESSLEA